MSQKALFLDRDGVINKDTGYVSAVQEFEFINGIFELCRCFQEKGYIIVIVTNQSGIARGLYSEEDFASLSKWMQNAFAKEGIEIAKVYHCPHHPEISGTCTCRKPEPGMLLKAIEEFDIDPSLSALVGDKPRDIEAGRRAGIARLYLFDAFKEGQSQETAQIIHTLQEACE
jgi:D-glycero-D-manno-heptose 1,7-bisphosphate phosphatase